MKQKTVDCLQFSAKPLEEREDLLLSMIQQYSIKAVLRKLQELARRNYIYVIDGDVLRGKITDTGKTVLENATGTNKVSA